MYLEQDVLDSLNLGNSALVNDEVFKKLLENSTSVLCGRGETHNTANLYNSKADVVKQFYAALLTTLAQFARHNLDEGAANDFLVNKCNYTPNRASTIATNYDRCKLDIQLQLGIIGTHLPHVTGVDWKIDYIVKSSNSDQSEGPLFRIALETETHDEKSQSKKSEQIEFVCNAQELQELVYKMKDAVRHCQRIVTEHQ